MRAIELEIGKIFLVPSFYQFPKSQGLLPSINFLASSPARKNTRQQNHNHQNQRCRPGQFFLCLKRNRCKVVHQNRKTRSWLIKSCRPTRRIKRRENQRSSFSSSASNCQS